MISKTEMAKIKIEKCSKCRKSAYGFVNGIPFCMRHFVSDYYGKNKSCMEEYLDELIDETQKRKLDKQEIQLLKEIKKQFPEIAQEFSRLFENI